MEPDELLAAYRRTRYTAETPHGRITLRIGERNTELDALLAAHGSTHWAYLTAWNPGSRLLPIEHNRRRQQELETALTEAGHVFYRGAGVPDPLHDGHWTPEESVLIMGIEPTEATEMARRFGQRGHVHGRLGGVPRLAFCETAASDR